jgi:hypothetical protein
MGKSIVLISILVPLIAVLGPSQTTNAQVQASQSLGEIAADEDLIRGIAILDRSGPSITPSDIVAQPKNSPRDVIGLTDQELWELKAVASDFETKNASFLARMRPLKMEALFQSLDAGQASEKLARQIDALQNEHANLVLSEVQRMRSALGDSRFNALSALIRPQKPR